MPPAHTNRASLSLQKPVKKKPEKQNKNLDETIHDTATSPSDCQKELPIKISCIALHTLFPDLP